MDTKEILRDAMLHPRELEQRLHEPLVQLRKVLKRSYSNGKYAQAHDGLPYACGLFSTLMTDEAKGVIDTIDRDVPKILSMRYNQEAVKKYLAFTVIKLVSLLKEYKICKEGDPLLNLLNWIPWIEFWSLDKETFEIWREEEKQRLEWKRNREAVQATPVVPKPRQESVQTSPPPSLDD